MAALFRPSYVHIPTAALSVCCGPMNGLVGTDPAGSSGGGGGGCPRQFLAEKLRGGGWGGGEGVK